MLQQVLAKTRQVLYQALNTVSAYIVDFLSFCNRKAAIYNGILSRINKVKEKKRKKMRAAPQSSIDRERQTFGDRPNI